MASSKAANEPTVDLVLQVRRALEKGALPAEALSSRGIAALLGQSTSVVYHRWGSLDGLLFAVATSGFDDLATKLETLLTEKKGAKKIAEAYVSFALDRAALYALMTERPFDADALRAGGITAKRPSPTRVVKALAAALGHSPKSAKGEDPDGADDVRLFHAALHGLAVLPGDREAALRAARRLVKRLG
jgi:AcrR family transcriptional regulator